MIQSISLHGSRLWPLIYFCSVWPHSSPVEATTLKSQFCEMLRSSRRGVSHRHAHESRQPSPSLRLSLPNNTRLQLSHCSRLHAFSLHPCSHHLPAGYDVIYAKICTSGRVHIHQRRTENFAIFHNHQMAVCHYVLQNTSVRLLSA